MFGRSIFLLILLYGHLPLAECGAQQSWLVSTTPAIDIRAVTADGELVLERAIAGTRLSGGYIVVADAQASALRMFDARGRLVKTVGRQGSGPGEFRNIAWMGQCGRDSVVVWDRGRARFTVVNADGMLVKETAVPLPPATATRLLTMTCSREGRFAYVTLPEDMRPSKDGIVRGQSTLVLVDATGAATTLPREVTSSELVVRGGGGVPRPLGRKTSIALSTDRLFIGTADSSAVDVYSLAGRRLGQVRVGGSTRPTTREHYERAVDGLVEMVPPVGQARVRQMLLQMPMPSRIPPYTGVFTDPSGVLWVLLSGPSDDYTHLRAVDLNGRQLGEVRLPVTLEVWEIGQDYVLGQYSDAEAEPHIVMYQIRRP